MIGLFFRNFYLYKHNKSEFATQSLLNIFQLLPLYFMLLFFYEEKKIINIDSTLLLYLITLFIINVTVEVNFHYNLDLLHNKAIEITLSGISKMQYILVQTSFSILINIVVCLIPNILLLSLYDTCLRLCNVFDFVKLLIVFILLILNVIDLNIILIHIVKKSGVFSYSTLITTMLLIISGAYNKIENFPVAIQFVSYLSPYTYFFLYIKHCFYNNALPFNSFMFFIVYLLITIIYHFTLKITIQQKFD